MPTTEVNVFVEEKKWSAYLNHKWVAYLPLIIFVVVAIVSLAAMMFKGAPASVIISTLVVDVIIALIIWALIAVGLVGWAWFVLLLPFIITMLIGIIAAGTALGMCTEMMIAEAMKN